MTIKDYIILALLAGCAVLWFTRGCGRSPLGINDCPEPTVIEKIVTVKGETKWLTPVSEPKETVQPMPIIKPVLVAVYQEKEVYVDPKDTTDIYSDWFIEREYEENVGDTNITATAKLKVQYNRLQAISLQYEFDKEEHTTLYDRFQMHTIGSFGINSDFDARARVNLGGGLLAEFKTGTGAGAKYSYSIGAPLPHAVEFLVTQRISFRKRK